MKKLVLTSVLLLSALAAQASVPAKTPIDPHVLEVLRLPPENRLMAAKNSDKDMYKDLIKVAFADDQSMRIRWRALMVAAETYGVKSTQDLLKAAQHKEWFMRNASLVALAEVNREQAERLALKLVKDKALVVRSAAVDILQKSVAPSTRDILWEELDQKYNFRNQQSLWIRSQIVEALASHPVDHELRIFGKLMVDGDVRVQSAAVMGLEKLTGTKLGESKMPREKVISLWQKYLHEEKVL